MKHWFGYLVRECECGFESPDEDTFQAHLRKTGHKQKPEPKPAKKTSQKSEKPKAAAAPAVKEAKGQEEENHDEVLLHK